MHNLDLLFISSFLNVIATSSEKSQDTSRFLVPKRVTFYWRKEEREAFQAAIFSLSWIYKREADSLWYWVLPASGFKFSYAVKIFFMGGNMLLSSKYLIKLLYHWTWTRSYSAIDYTYLSWDWWCFFIQVEQKWEMMWGETDKGERLVGTQSP